MPTPIVPSESQYGEWQVYYAEKLKDKIVKSSRTYIANIDENGVTLGRFSIALSSPHVYIIHARHNIEEGNVSGGKLQGQFVYDIIVETTYPGDLDRAEKEAVLMTGDIISELFLDPHLLDESGNHTCRGLDMTFLEPVYPFDVNTKDLYVQVGVEVTIYKSMYLS